MGRVTHEMAWTGTDKLVPVSEENGTRRNRLKAGQDKVRGAAGTVWAVTREGLPRGGSRPELLQVKSRTASLQLSPP